MKLHGRKYYQIGKNRYVHYGNLERVTYADQYKPKKKKDVTVDRGKINPKTYHFPNPKTLVKSSKKFPRHTKIVWDKLFGPHLIMSETDAGDDADIDVKYPDGSEDDVKVNINYIRTGTNHIKLPSEYTPESIAKAVSDPDSLAKAAKKGNKLNKYYYTENKKEMKEKINLNHLTPAQEKEISEFALRLINEARAQLGKPKWYYSADAQKLADDVAQEYLKNGRGIQDHEHYVPGLVRAANKNGYDIDGINQIEDMAGSEDDGLPPKTMDELKSQVDGGICEFLFSGDEFNHCADITSCHPESWWNDSTAEVPFAVSVSDTKGYLSIHYISIPSDILATKQN